MFDFFGNAGAISNYRGSVLYTGDATIDISNKNIFLDASSNDITLTVPSAIDKETLSFTVNRIDDSVNTVNLVPTGAETINTETSINLYYQDSITIVSDNENWYITCKTFSTC